MAKNGTGKTRAGRFFASVTDRVYAAIAKSPVGRFFSAYAASDRVFRESAVSCLPGMGRHRKRGNPVRRGVARAMDRSLLRRASHSIIRGVCHYSLRTVGLFLLTMGAYTAIFNWLIASVWQGNAPDAFQWYVGLSLAVVGMLLLCSDLSVGYALSKGRISGFVLREMLGISEDVLADMPRTGRQGYVVTVPLGMLMGAVTALLGPAYLFLGWVLFLVGLLVFMTPEAGIVLLVLYAPFGGLLPVGTLWMALLAFLSLTGYLCKLLRGTRAFHMEIQDFVVLLLLLLTLLCGVSAGVGAWERVVLLALLLALYFPAVNTLATPQWLTRCRCALLGSATVASMLGILQFVLAAVVAVQSPREVAISSLGEAVRAGFADQVAFAFFMVAVFPVALYTFLRARPRYRILSGLTCVSVLIATALSFVQSAWVALALEIAVLVFLCARRAVPYLLAGLVLLPVAFLLLPHAWRDGIAEVLLRSGDMSAVRLRAAGKLISRLFFEGGEGFFGLGAGVLRLLFGLGAGGVERVSVLYSEVGAVELVPTMNFWLYSLATGGILGILLPVALIVLLLQNCFSSHRLVKERGVCLPLAGVVTVCGVLFFFAFRSPLYDAAAVLAFLAVIFLISADARYHRSAQSPMDVQGNSISYAEAEYQIKATKGGFAQKQGGSQ